MFDQQFIDEYLLPEYPFCFQPNNTYKKVIDYVNNELSLPIINDFSKFKMKKFDYTIQLKSTIEKDCFFIENNEKNIIVIDTHIFDYLGALNLTGYFALSKEDILPYNLFKLMCLLISEGFYLDKRYNSALLAIEASDLTQGSHGKIKCPVEFCIAQTSFVLAHELAHVSLYKLTEVDKIKLLDSYKASRYTNLTELGKSIFVKGEYKDLTSKITLSMIEELLCDEIATQAVIDLSRKLNWHTNIQRCIWITICELHIIDLTMHVFHRPINVKKRFNQMRVYWYLENTYSKSEISNEQSATIQTIDEIENIQNRLWVAFLKYHADRINSNRYNKSPELCQKLYIELWELLVKERLRS